MRGAAERTVLIGGATSAAGVAAVGALVAAGATVVATGRDRDRLAPLAAMGARIEAVDLVDEVEVSALASRLHADGIAVDGVLHLVGGWRGGGGIAGQTEADYRVLEASFTALRHVSRAFDEDLRRSPAGRLAIVSSTTVDHPAAGGANYAAVKAASEAWVRAVGQGYRKAARDAGEPQRAAAVIFRVASLAGLESALADAFVDLWDADAAAVDGAVIELRDDVD
ncbi:SDR family NAD(P)-dependent oxidoreductase [Demequina sp. SYSU T00039]|uniref:SDR family NAD(P)-dependent oxidoreductase n=1 Tax=Demequina lignilytica TaxID=3051663 RepID=A0AAW7M9W9_9MICO|nr:MULTISPECIES: SDR family NAD(P)-dependent oxidoreductase [unclassified Demequina]MDN4479297.1 SDR family NAD(P)-dependent oxidoreductase [Demequina sp. SYSU T00039-1]MDN4488756.1 SDR family NAD(P)-dependent oxidoreductase [Demequina sp. SYSU T00039]MDN4490914.1 SDR family NAD(P)-dependent oxidoreductase [Demequina sp. SYSU T00068]